MDDLVAFLRARLDELERIALDAIADDCGQDGGFEDYDRLVNPPFGTRYGEAAARMISTVAVPRRILAEVKAKRLLTELHAPVLEIVEWSHDQTGKGEAFVCSTCANRDTAAWEAWHPAEGEAGVLPEGVIPPYVVWPCPIMRVVASVYADHPDYRAEWAPAE